MSIVIFEVYDALKEAGASDEKAKAAAQARGRPLPTPSQRLEAEDLLSYAGRLAQSPHFGGDPLALQKALRDSPNPRRQR